MTASAIVHVVSTVVVHVVSAITQIVVISVVIVVFRTVRHDEADIWDFAAFLLTGNFVSFELVFEILSVLFDSSVESSLYVCQSLISLGFEIGG